MKNKKIYNKEALILVILDNKEENYKIFLDKIGYIN